MIFIPPQNFVTTSEHTEIIISLIYGVEECHVLMLDYSDGMHISLSLLDFVNLSNTAANTMVKYN